MDIESLNPSIDIDLAAKTRASAKTEAKLKFDMEHWQICGTTACLAGHAEAAQGKDLKEDFEFGKHIGEQAVADLLQLPLEARELTSKKKRMLVRHKEWSSLTNLFTRFSLDNEEALKEFDSFIQEHTTEEEYQTYLRKSWGYEGYLTRASSDN